MGRIKTGWHLTKKSWAVLKADKSLMVFPILATIFVIIAFILIWTPTVFLDPDVLNENAQKDPVLWVVAVVSAFVSTTLAIYFQVALASCALRSLQGEDTRVSEGLRAANSRLGAILGWGVVATTIGLILRAIEQRFQLAGAIASWILGAAWAIASFFAMPVIAAEGEGPLKTLKRSAQIVRQKWGEGFTGSVAISAITVLAGLAVIVVFGGAAVLVAASSVASAVVVGAVGVLALILVTLISATLSQVFRVAVYRYAITGEVDAGFTQDELEGAFRPKKRHR